MQQFAISFEETKKETPAKDENPPVCKEGVRVSAVVSESISPPVAVPLQSAAEPRIATVSELTRELKKLVEGAFMEVWVTGEVSNFRNPTSRHYYFSLKDEECQLSAVLFGGRDRLSFDLVDGLELVCRGRITVYGPRGNYQIVIEECFPKGKGALQLAFEQLKKKLDDEGLFKREHKKPLPFLPRKIGVVTSPTGAAIRDIIHVLTRRYPAIEILLYPVKVQGEGAAAEIARAIAAMNRRIDIDVLIVGRGGGSLEDLWAFNEEVVARAIFASRIPLISAVGHEIDFTIADFVADVRAPTPSAAAEIVVPVRAELVQLIRDRRRQLTLALRHRVTNAEAAVARLKARVPDPRRMIPDLLLRVDSSRERLLFSLRVMFERLAQRVSAFGDNLAHLSPLAILEKGYAVVTRENGEALRSTRGLKVGEAVALVLHEGRAGAKISKIIE